MKGASRIFFRSGAAAFRAGVWAWCFLLIEARGSAQDFSAWKQGLGAWNVPGNWSAGLPTGTQRAVIHGDSTVVIGEGIFTAGDLEVGLDRGDHARVELNGGKLLLLQDSLRVGEYTGGQAEFVLMNGALHCAMDVFVGAASAVPGRATKASMTIRGGEFLGRTLTVGVGLGARSLLAIEGSRATGIQVLDYCYLEALPDPSGAQGESALSFTLDEHGVTPIAIQSPRDGLRIITRGQGRCELRVALNAVPPRGDITLVSSRVPIRGEFTGRPEGSVIVAAYQNVQYRWQLTYRGGTGGHDLTLKSEERAEAASAPASKTPTVPAPLWREHRLFPLSIPIGQPVFAGAEGFGAFTPGGRNGKGVVVDTLADAGPGSLRAAMEMAGPRTVIFRVGGPIALRSPIVVKEPFLTVDASEAPGSGIMLRDHGIEVQTHDVVLRHFRIRIGDEEILHGGKNLSYYEGGGGEHALYFAGAENCIADHLSLGWSTGKILSVTKMSDRITIQWCLLSESLNIAEHGYASIAGGNRVTWHHNLFAHNLSRNVRFQGLVVADFRNNVIYDWGHTAGYGEFDRLNYIGNFLKPGPSTTQRPPLFHSGVEVVDDASLFVADNVLAGDAKATAENWRGFGYYYFERQRIRADTPFPAAPVSTDPANVAYDRVLADAGATRPRRDSVDTRVVAETRGGSGRIVQSVAEAGGWPEFLSATARPDSAHR
jgi:hypothetical protein